MKFYHTLSPDVQADFQSLQILNIQSLQNLNVAEEVYCHYNNSYNYIICVIQLYFGY